jgi:hypothetical protein
MQHLRFAQFRGASATPQTLCYIDRVLRPKNTEGANPFRISAFKNRRPEGLAAKPGAPHSRYARPFCEPHRPAGTRCGYTLHVVSGPMSHRPSPPLSGFVRSAPSNPSRVSDVGLLSSVRTALRAAPTHEKTAGFSSGLSWRPHGDWLPSQVLRTRAARAPSTLRSVKPLRGV